ncbi:uncharacterized protein BT62DRAFT_936921 [Guyanagaster necrorhizus]|uniref:Uncharacterized protein n=1 Tax=Guyanagaster necrorhizus TaxID=856835 RepID=A0A9P8AP88_9AGAR|nr:uncharacterized protein BT62DRAFT_936921 [Guyanagaster necrorhizus MCA 3950]KAG7441607.1 hypothetical protein BT62DRAFT_936921 [Guyanagaster necrorhizus MCA 3950]
MPAQLWHVFSKGSLTSTDLAYIHAKRDAKGIGDFIGWWHCLKIPGPAADKRETKRRWSPGVYDFCIIPFGRCADTTLSW